MKRLILLFCLTSLSVSASEEHMMSTINSTINNITEMTQEEYVKEILQGTVCKWELSEEERLFIENY